MNVIETAGLGRRYWRTWALRDCTLAIPSGRVAALAGPNGAGKTTLMHMAVGLIAPTQGRVTVLGGRPAGSPAGGHAPEAPDVPPRPRTAWTVVVPSPLREADTSGHHRS